MLKKIVVIGPESTGKSTLCRQLAQHFHTVWVPEYAREYLLQHGTHYRYEDLYKIALGQLKGEEEILLKVDSNNNTVQPVFFDTDLYVIKVWSEFVFNKCDNRILTEIAVRKYDLYLLCNIDVKWIKDELREYPDIATREKLFHYYKEAMTAQATTWTEVTGDYNERLQKAIYAVEGITKMS